MSSDRLEASLNIDRIATLDMVRIVQNEDHRVADAVAAQAENIARAVDAIADRLSHGGKLFYVGAGTSGRIAMLDAAEIPPTYGTDPGMVQVIMAGGDKAFLGAAEGAEDREEEAIAEVNRRVKAEDCVTGIAASGTTPFTVAAVRRANMLGALTVGVTSAPGSPLARETDIPIVVETGPEVIFGSTRMKSGTAQKLVLNTLSTCVMVKLGRTYSNLMIDMPATNAKLRSRARLMVEIAAGTDRASAEKALEASEGNIRQAIVMVKKNVPAAEARRLLDQHGGNLREVLEG
jgi:N-acetylmuramic acid 6-phosphate etherase